MDALQSSSSLALVVVEENGKIMFVGHISIILKLQLTEKLSCHISVAQVSDLVVSYTETVSRRR